ncbi:MAG: GMC family oxidoreductase [Acidobacteria bacterium]|nr:GMC family oxidoreductase [Acidobacteriota bacterium]
MQARVRDNEVYDAVIVGSGATGGWAAKQLAEAGLKVAVLEAGSRTTPDQFGEHVPPYEMKYRDTSPGGVASPEIARLRPIQATQGACSETNWRWYVNDIENPYTTPDDMPFRWIRVRAVGGRSLAWGRQSYRLSDLDFKAATHDGYGVDWPIDYAEMAPYYSQVERFIGVSGQAEGLAHFPDSDFLPPMAYTCGDQRLKARVEKRFGRLVTIGRTAILTKEHNGRAACHYCGPCNRGCITYSYYSSPFTTLRAAEETGRLTLIPDAVASHITLDKASGRANGVAYLERFSRTAREIRAKRVVLCASTLESVRLLLTSAPGGLGNGSGVLGRYIMDHMYGGQVSGVFDDMPAKPWHGAPRRPNGLFIPRFRNVDKPHTNGLIRGYSYQGASVPRFAMHASGFGKRFKQAVHDEADWSVGVHGFVECLPDYDNYCELDPSRVDAWGIPALRIHMKWRDNEKALFQDALGQGAEMLEAAGAKKIRQADLADARLPGFGIHEVGGARMGDNPKTSVADRWGRLHEVPNVWLMDGAVYPSMGTVNPTLTMMANAVRCCEKLAADG